MAADSTGPGPYFASPRSCFSFCLWTVKTIVEARVAWRKQRLERISKLLDEYWWPLLLLLVELRDAQTILENADTAAQASAFRDTALKRKVELAWISVVRSLA